jgi:3-hydroxyisobutyrate dehydrogenase
MTSELPRVGVVGLGHMGSPLANNLVKAGFSVDGFDLDRDKELPAGVRRVDTLGEISAGCEAVVLSLPNAAAATRVAEELAATKGALAAVADTSTIGIAGAHRVAAILGARDIEYADAPVSGGVAAAVAGSIAVMFAGSEVAYERLGAVLAGISSRVFRIGDRPGLGQAVKVANNFLSATALAATSEAFSLLESLGLDMREVLVVLNSSSGMSAATMDKFPNHVATATYSSGFSNALMDKDLSLYRAAATEGGVSTSVATVVADVWHRFATDQPDVDFTRIYPFVQGAVAKSRADTSREDDDK